MLTDKGYYDYDYEAVKKKAVLTAEEKEVWSSEKINAILGVRPKGKGLSPEELQAEVLKSEQLKRKNNSRQG